MTSLREMNNQEFLRELRERIQANQIREDEVAQLLEKEVWKKAYQEAAQDEKRWKEAEEWELAQMHDWIKHEHERKNN